MYWIDFRAHIFFVGDCKHLRNAIPSHQNVKTGTNNFSSVDLSREMSTPVTANSSLDLTFRLNVARQVFGPRKRRKICRNMQSGPKLWALLCQSLKKFKLIESCTWISCHVSLHDYNFRIFWVESRNPFQKNGKDREMEKWARSKIGRRGGIAWDSSDIFCLCKTLGMRNRCTVWTCPWVIFFLRRFATDISNVFLSEIPKC